MPRIDQGYVSNSVGVFELAEEAKDDSHARVQWLPELSSSRLLSLSASVEWSEI